MADVKLVVTYPLPKDVDVFEKIYPDEHVPPTAKLNGKTKIVATKLGSLQGTRGRAAMMLHAVPC